MSAIIRAGLRSLRYSWNFCTFCANTLPFWHKKSHIALNNSVLSIILSIQLFWFAVLSINLSIQLLWLELQSINLSIQLLWFAVLSINLSIQLLWFENQLFGRCDYYYVNNWLSIALPIRIAQPYQTFTMGAYSPKMYLRGVINGLYC